MISFHSYEIKNEGDPKAIQYGQRVILFLLYVETTS